MFEDVSKVKQLIELGELLGERPERMIDAAEEILRVRGRDGELAALRANKAQRAFEQSRGQHNIVLKARQMGMTTWVAAQFFLKTITASVC